ncbi:MAG TPA: DUF819 family protein, partial [Longimicrobiales bacterium]|nr:DUF819 family protein [Longimicrobiales bacterium]
FRFFRAFGAALVGILLGMVLSNAGLIPGESPVYDFLMGPAVSAGIILILLSVDVRTVVQAGPTMLAAFAIGAVGSAVGATVGALVLSGAVGPDTWKLAGQFSATYTGGGANFAAVGAALGTSGELFSAGIAADVIVTAVWMAACLAVPVIWARGAAPTGAPEAEEIDHAAAAGKLYASVGAVGLMDVGLMVTIVFGTLWLSGVLGDLLAPIPAVLWLTTIALLLAQIPRVGRIRGAGVLGNYLVLLFLASNGAKSVVANILAVGPPVVYYALITVALHGAVIFGLGSLVGLDLRTLAVASQANVGGPASAMALATARGYADRLLPGVAVGLLGYAVGNYIGLSVAWMVRGILGA